MGRSVGRLVGRVIDAACGLWLLAAGCWSRLLAAADATTSDRLSTCPRRLKRD